MKAFHFRLDQALRWRATQREVEKSKLSAAAKRVADIRTELDTRRTELSDAGRQLGPVTSGAALESLSAYQSKTRRRIAEIEKALVKAEQDLAVQTKIMLEADRRLRLIENLKENEQTQWQKDLSRELEAFASDTFLGRLQSRKRARSSSG